MTREKAPIWQQTICFDLIMDIKQITHNNKEYTELTCFEVPYLSKLIYLLILFKHFLWRQDGSDYSIRF